MSSDSEEVLSNTTKQQKNLLVPSSNLDDTIAFFDQIFTLIPE